MMRLALLFSTCILAAAAQPPAPDEREALRAHFEQAQREWQKVDANLEREAMTAPPQGVLKRVKDAQARRAAVSNAKARYFAAVQLRCQSVLQDLNAPGPPGASFKEVDAKEVGALLNDTATDLAEELNAAPPRAVEIHALYTERRELLEKLAALDGALAADRKALAAAHAKLTSALATQAARIESETSAWNALYDALRQAVLQRASSPVPGP